jgi:hypothetical protein
LEFFLRPKKCVACAEKIKPDALLCKHCGVDQSDSKFPEPVSPTAKASFLSNSSKSSVIAVSAAIVLLLGTGAVFALNSGDPEGTLTLPNGLKSESGGLLSPLTAKESPIGESAPEINPQRPGQGRAEGGEKAPSAAEIRATDEESLKGTAEAEARAAAAAEAERRAIAEAEKQARQRLQEFEQGLLEERRLSYDAIRNDLLLSIAEEEENLRRLEVGKSEAYAKYESEFGCTYDPPRTTACPDGTSEQFFGSIRAGAQLPLWDMSITQSRDSIARYQFSLSRLVAP